MHQFYTLHPKMISTFGGGNEIYNSLPPYPRDATYQMYWRLAQQFLRRKFYLTHDDGRQPIAMCIWRHILQK